MEQCGMELEKQGNGAETGEEIKEARGADGGGRPDDLSISYYRTQLVNLWISAESFFKWTFIGAVVGIICGLFGALFYHGLVFSDAFFQVHHRLIFLLPLAGVLVVGLYRITGSTGQNLDTMVESVSQGKRLPLKLLPAVIGGTWISHFFGGSAGKEGAAFQIGDTLGNFIARLLRLDANDAELCSRAGMAALFAAIFGTPVTATFFITMLTTSGSFFSISMLPNLIAAIAAHLVASRLGVHTERYAVDIPLYGTSVLWRVAVLSALGAVLSTVVCDVLHATSHFMQRLLPNRWIRALVGGALVAAVMLLDGTYGYAGGSSYMMDDAILLGTARPHDFILKLILTAVTLGAGLVGGEVMPVFFIGATFGAFAGPLLGLPGGFSAALGVIVVFGGATNSLFAPFALAGELFGGLGSGGIVYFAFASIVSYLLSGYASLYYSQTIVFSKSRASYIGVHANDAHSDRSLFAWRARRKRRR
ncbi:chloride channel protein [Lachnoclostridium sp. Marseille-P6806]|uniref:chloride channel protein n=1 Tax=Lachnoclostridium sp. Marseille-P6806 TaxID=2364793 RepID=UPI001030744C|nr:chloride channel protein [Lachnoclostridium sp. Marseille-P6806]